MYNLPSDIKNDMKLFRMGLISAPVSYINFHNELAEKDMILKVEKGLFVVITDIGLVYDGWGDNFKFRSYVVASLKGQNPNNSGDWEIITVKWHDSGAWFRDTGAGWSRHSEMETV